jgi:Na+/proline symporter
MHVLNLIFLSSIVLAVNVLGSIPGMPGLFLSTIFSATLSTLSSGLNSIVAVLWEDICETSYTQCSRLTSLYFSETTLHNERL